MTVHALTLKEVEFLIANKPLALVNLEHSDHNKKIIISALTRLFSHPAGSATFDTLQEFLANVAPKYRLSANQDGVRTFLLGAMRRISSPTPETSLVDGLQQKLRNAGRQLQNATRSKASSLVSLTSWLQ